MQALHDILRSDPWRLAALEALRAHGPAQAWLAAGFVRNAVWDALHGHPEATPLNDLDVIYFDPEDLDVASEQRHEARLQAVFGGARWQVRNQARMHRRNGDAPYRDLCQAMAHWPERETAVAVRLTAKGELQGLAAFGWDSLFALQLNPGPWRERAVFEQRLARKGWLRRWPQLRVMG